MSKFGDLIRGKTAEPPVVDTPVVEEPPVVAPAPASVAAPVAHVRGGRASSARAASACAALCTARESGGSWLRCVRRVSAAPRAASRIFLYVW